MRVASTCCTFQLRAAACMLLLSCLLTSALWKKKEKDYTGVHSMSCQVLYQAAQEVLSAVTDVSQCLTTNLYHPPGDLVLGAHYSTCACKALFYVQYLCMCGITTAEGA